MPEMDEEWFHEIRYTNSQLRKKGMRLRPKPPGRTNFTARTIENDTKFLKTCGVAWEPELAHQIPLDFSSDRDIGKETHTFVEAHIKNECSSCHGTGKCQACKGTGRFGYPGVGKPDLYRTTCGTCQGSGDCRACDGTGQR